MAVSLCPPVPRCFCKSFFSFPYPICPPLKKEKRKDEKEKEEEVMGGNKNKGKLSLSPRPLLLLLLCSSSRGQIRQSRRRGEGNKEKRGQNGRQDGRAHCFPVRLRPRPLRGRHIFSPRIYAKIVRECERGGGEANCFMRGYRNKKLPSSS